MAMPVVPPPTPMPVPVAPMPMPSPVPVMAPTNLLRLQTIDVVLGHDRGSRGLGGRRCELCRRHRRQRCGIRGCSNRGRTCDRAESDFQKMTAFHDVLPCESIKGVSLRLDERSLNFAKLPTARRPAMTKNCQARSANDEAAYARNSSARTSVLPAALLPCMPASGPAIVGFPSLTLRCSSETTATAHARPAIVRRGRITTTADCRASWRAFPSSCRAAWQAPLRSAAGSSAA